MENDGSAGFLDRRHALRPIASRAAEHDSDRTIAVDAGRACEQTVYRGNRPGSLFFSARSNPDRRVGDFNVFPGAGTT